MVRIEWSQLAYEDLDSIFMYIAKDSPFYAERQIETLVNRVDILEKFPLAGKIVPEFNNETIRELPEGNYRIIYNIQGNYIAIVRVHHTSKKLTSL